MDPKPRDPVPQSGFDRTLFETRLHGFKQAKNPVLYQAYDKPSFL